MRLELLTIKLNQLKLKYPNNQYTAYTSENDYKELITQWKNETTNNLFNNDIIINNITVKQHSKINTNEIIILWKVEMLYW